MNENGEPDISQRIDGLALTQSILIEALLRYDAIGYHQLKDTLAEALGALAASGRVAEPSLRPLRRLLERLELTHGPLDRGARRQRFDRLEFAAGDDGA